MHRDGWSMPVQNPGVIVASDAILRRDSPLGRSNQDCSADLRLVLLRHR
jgi:hypothetical protein